jgi:hypothetical protein
MEGTFSAIVEGLWWAFVAVLAGVFLVRAVRGRLAARRKARSARAEAGVGPVIRKFEEEQLARMEAEGLPIWRPDPAKLKRISERQS